MSRKSAEQVRKEYISGSSTTKRSAAEVRSGYIAKTQQEKEQRKQEQQAQNRQALAGAIALVRSGGSTTTDTSGTIPYKTTAQSSSKATAQKSSLSNVGTTPYELATGSTDPMKLLAYNQSTKKTEKKKTRDTAHAAMDALPDGAEEDVKSLLEDRENWSTTQKIADRLKGTEGIFGNRGNKYYKEMQEATSNDESTVSGMLQSKYGISKDKADYYEKNWNSIQDILEREESEKADEELMDKYDDDVYKLMKTYNENRDAYSSYSANAGLSGMSPSFSAQSEFLKSANAAKKELQEKYGLTGDEFTAYSDAVKRKTNAEDTEERDTQIEDFITEHPVAGGTVMSAVDVLTSPLQGTLALAGTLTGQDTNSNFYALQNMANTTESAVTNNISSAITKKAKENGWSESGTNTAIKLANFAYGTGMSAAKSGFTMLLGGEIASSLGLEGEAATKVAELVTLPTFGASAFTTTLQDELGRGIGETEAYKTAFANGLNEMLFEKLSLDSVYSRFKVNGKSGVADYLKDWAIQSGIEGSEEVFTDLANSLADSFINGDFSEYQTNIRTYIEQGMSEDEAKKKAALNYVGQLAEDFAGGALAGAVHGAGALIANNIHYKSAGTTLNKAENLDEKTKLVEAAKQMNTNTTAYQLATTKTLEALTDEDMGQILASAQQTSTEEVESVLEAELEERGESADTARSYARTMVEMAEEPSDEVSVLSSAKRVRQFSGNDNATEVYANFLRGEYDDRLTVNNALREVVSVLGDEDYKTDAGNGDLGVYAAQSTGANVADNTAGVTADTANGDFLGQNVRTNAGENVTAGVTSDSAAGNVSGLNQNIQRSGNRAVDALISNQRNIKKVNALVDGERVQVTGFSGNTSDASKVVVMSTDGTARETTLDQVTLPENIRAIYYSAADLGDTYAANAAVNDYKGESATLYNIGIKTAYYTGRAGQFSYDQFKNLPHNATIFAAVNELALREEYELGHNAYLREQEETKKAASATKSVQERKGKTTGRFGGMEKAVEAHAKKTGLDIESTKNVEHNANGYFAPSTMKIVLNEDKNLYQTLMHETNEFADTFNPEGMKEVYDSVINWMATERGASYLASMGSNYLKRYQAVNEGETYREALEELSNDVIGAMFSTDEGIQEYVTWLNEDSGLNQKERKSIIDTIVDFFQKLFDSIKSYVDNHNLSRNTEIKLSDSAERIKHIREQVLQEWDKAIENSKSAENGKVAPVQQKYSEADTDFMRGGKPLSISNNEMNENLHLVHNMESVGTVNFEKFQIGKDLNENVDTLSKHANNQGWGKVHSDELGTIEISGNGIRDIIRHGNVEFKASVINAIPEVLSKGKIVSADQNHKGKTNKNGKGFNTVVMVAPVTFTGTGYKNDEAGTYFAAVSVVRKQNFDGIDQRIHVTDVLTTKKGTSRKASPAKGGLQTEATSLNLRQILEHVDADVNIFDEDSEKKDYSLPEQEITDLEDFFGTTNNYDVAGYLLEDGKMLDFSGKHWGDTSSRMRQVDHREVWDVWENDETDGDQEMARMIGNGEIRLSPESGGINLAMMPNEEQTKTLKKYFSHFSGEVYVDIDSEEGKTVKTLQYDKGTSSDAILSDLQEYFDKKSRYTSAFSEFLYSMPIDEAWENVMNGNASDLMVQDKTYDFAKGVQYSDFPSILEEGYNSLQNVEVNEKAIKSIAHDLVREYASSYDEGTLSDNIARVFAFMKENDNLQFADLYRVMKEVAEPMVQQSKTYDAKEQKVYRDFRDAFKGRTFKVSEEQANYLEYMYGEPFHKIAFRYNTRFKLSKTEGEDLDGSYENLIAESGYVLDMVSPKEEAYAIMDMMESLRPQPNVSSGANTMEQSYDAALEIFGKYYEMQARTEANEKAKKYINELRQKQKVMQEKNALRMKSHIRDIRTQEEAKRKEQADYYKEKLENAKKSKSAAIAAKDREAAEKYKRMEERYRKKLDQAYQNRSETIDRLLAKNRLTARTIRENQERASAKEQIKKNAGAIVTYFNTNTDKKHIPETLKNPIASFITAIDFTGATDSKAAQEWEQSLRLMKDRLANREAAEKDGYEDIYQALHGFGDKQESAVLSDMENFLDTYSGAKVTELSTESLKQLNKILRALRTCITNSNKLFVNKRTQYAQDIGRETIRELEERKDKRNHNKAVNAGLNILDAGMLDSRSYFYQLGAAGMSIYQGIREGFNERVWKLKDAQTYMENAMQGMNVKDWTGNHAKVHTFVINGGELKLTTAQIMSIYELRKRGQALVHMLNGGIKPTQIGKGAKAITRVKPMKNLTEFDLDNITSVLTAEQRQLADAMQQYMAGQCARWGNDTSMLLYGYERFNASSYFPISVDGNSVDTKDDTQFFGLKNKGFTKSTTKNAGNALIVGDIFDIFTKHVTDMASYSTFTAPLMDAMKWFNFRDMDYSGDVAVNNGAVKTEIDRVFGHEYLEYFEKLVKDINAESSNDFTDNMSRMLVSNMKAASVGANLRVAIQQPTAVMRAMAVMNPKYLAKAYAGKSYMKKAQENSAITQWKSWGYFETSIGMSMKNIITGQSTLKEKVVEKSMTLAQLGDDITWGYIWKACELEISDTHKELKYDSPEYIQEVAKRFDDVVDQTQVVDSVLHRSHIMRNQNGVVQMATSFMAEPTKTYNLMVNALRDTLADKRGAKKKLARVAVVYTITNFVNAMAQAVMDAVRDDDDDKLSFMEKWEKFLMENFADNMNPLGIIPYAKDIISMLQGYDVNRMDMQALSNFINGAQYAMKWILNEKDSSGKTYREKKTFYQAFRGLMQGASQLAGIPVYNALRDIAGLYHTFTGKTFGGKAYSRADRYEIMAEAYQEGNTEIYEKEMEKLLDFGVDEETVETGVRSKLQDQLKEGTGDEETYSEYLKEVTGWDDDKIQKSIQDTKYGEEKDSLKEGLQNGTVTEETYIQFLMENYGMDEADATYAAIKAEYNATSEYAAVWNAVDNAIADESDSNRQALTTEVKRMIDLGKTKQSILNTLKNHYGDAYATAKANRKAADIQNILITALMSAGYSKSEAMEKISSWEKSDKK